MDACDPTINIKDLKTLIKQNTGADLKLSRSQICDVYATTQDGKLPLPPLIISSDRSFLYDRKSPLTRLDFEKLFSSTTKIASIRRIAKKVGVSRHSDPTLTKRQLVDIIGRRLRGLNINEPIRLRTIPKRKTETNYGNVNSNSTLNYNNNANGNVNVNRNRNININRNATNNTGVRNNNNNSNNTPIKIKFKPSKLIFKKSNSNDGRAGIYSATKMVNRGRERLPSNLFNKYFNRRSTSNRVLSSNKLAARDAEKVVFYSNKPENAYKKLVTQGKINEPFNTFKKKYDSEKKKFYKITNAEKITTGKKTPFKGSRISLFGKQKTNTEPQTPQASVTQSTAVPQTPQASVTQSTAVPQTPQASVTQSTAVPRTPVARNLNANFKREQEKELRTYLNDNEIANQSVRNGFIKMLNNGTNLSNIKTKIRNKISKNLEEQQKKNNANRKEQQEKNNAIKRRNEGNALKNTYNTYNSVSINNKNKIISNYVNGKKKQVRAGFFGGTKNGNGPMYASINNVKKEISNRNAKSKANITAKETKERLNTEAQERKEKKKANRNAKNEQQRLNKEEKEEKKKEEKEARKNLVVTLLKQNRFQNIKTNPAVLKIAERFIDQKPFAAKNIEGVESKIKKIITLAFEGDERKRRISLSQYAKAQGLNLNNKNVIELIKNPTSTNKNINELVKMRNQDKQKREAEVQDIRNDEENVINANVNTILKTYVNGKSEYTNINKVKEAIEKVKTNKGLVAEQKVKNKEKLERKVETYKGVYGNTFNTVSKPVLNAFNKGTINYKTADNELDKLVQKNPMITLRLRQQNNATNLARKQTGAIALRNMYKNKLNDPTIQKIISNFETRKTKGFFSSNVKYKTINNANAAIQKIQQNKENKQTKLNIKEKNKQNKSNKKEAEKQANVQKRQESRKEFEQFLKNQTNPRLSYENIMKMRSISLLHNHVHLRGKNVSVAKEEAKKIIDDKKKEILKSPNKNSSKNTENINDKVKRINQEAEKRKLANLEESKKKQAKSIANAAKLEKERRNAKLDENIKREMLVESERKRNSKKLFEKKRKKEEKDKRWLKMNIPNEKNIIKSAGKLENKVKKNQKILENKRREKEDKKKAAQNQQLRASLTKKVKSVQMDQKVKNKLLNQLKNYSVPIKNIAPSIEQTIKSEKLNGNLNEAENKKKRQQVKKNITNYISKKVPNMPKANRKKYIDQANLKQWKIGVFSGSQGMSANQAFERIRKNINKNVNMKKKKNQDDKEIANRERKRVQSKLINAMRNNKPPPPRKNKKANLKKLVNNTMKGRAAKNVSRLKKNINEGVSEMAVKTRLAQLNKQTKYQQK